MIISEDLSDHIAEVLEKFSEANGLDFELAGDYDSDRGGYATLYYVGDFNSPPVKLAMSELQKWVGRLKDVEREIRGVCEWCEVYVRYIDADSGIKLIIESH